MTALSDPRSDPAIKKTARGGAVGPIGSKRSGDSNQTSLRLFQASRHFAFNADLILGQKCCHQSIFNRSGTTSDGLQLIKGEFCIAHWFEVWWRFFPLMHTTFPQSTADLMTWVKGACDVGRTSKRATKNLPLLTG